MASGGPFALGTASSVHHVPSGCPVAPARGAVVRGPALRAPKRLPDTKRRTRCSTAEQNAAVAQLAQETYMAQRFPGVVFGAPGQVSVLGTESRVHCRREPRFSRQRAKVAPVARGALFVSHARMPRLANNDSRFSCPGTESGRAAEKRPPQTYMAQRFQGQVGPRDEIGGSLINGSSFCCPGTEWGWCERAPGRPPGPTATRGRYHHHRGVKSRQRARIGTSDHEWSSRG